MSGTNKREYPSLIKKIQSLEQNNPNKTGITYALLSGFLNITISVLTQRIQKNNFGNFNMLYYMFLTTLPVLWGIAKYNNSQFW